MYDELTLSPSPRQVFLQKGFYHGITPNSRLHKHHYTEVHLVSEGSCRFTVGKDSYSVQSGEMLVIPPHTFHCCPEQEEHARHTAFQVDHTVEELVVYKLPAELIREFHRQLTPTPASGNYALISAYLSLFCGYFLEDNAPPPQPSADEGFLIQEFFMNRYGEDLCLRDLAEMLHLSERQTERLVVAQTGHTFREELALTRLTIAENLAKNSTLSRREIAEYVGYRSYAGFWKAIKRFQSS